MPFTNSYSYDIFYQQTDHLPPQLKFHLLDVLKSIKRCIQPQPSIRKKRSIIIHTRIYPNIIYQWARAIKDFVVDPTINGAFVTFERDRKSIIKNNNLSSLNLAFLNFIWSRAAWTNR